MFEKEAESSFDELEDIIVGDDWSIEESYVNGFSNGAEFGYNKANEWHKVADGDLPKDARYVWTNIGASYYDSWDRCWRDEYGRVQGVIAWCEPQYKE